MPDDPSYLWSRARRMQPPAAPPNRLPTVEEMHFLRHVAASVCAVPDDSRTLSLTRALTLVLSLSLSLSLSLTRCRMTARR